MAVLRRSAPTTTLLALTLSLGYVFPGCGGTLSPSDVAGVYRLDPSTVPESSATDPNGQSAELLQTLGIILRDSVLTLGADGTYEWESFFLPDERGRWSLQGDLVTMQPAKDSGKAVVALSLRVGKGTLAVLPNQGEDGPQDVLMLRKQ